MTRRHRRALDIYLAARRAVARGTPTRAKLTVFRWADARLARRLLADGPIATARSRFTPEYDAVEGRWRVREERAEFHGDGQWRAA